MPWPLEDWSGCVYCGDQTPRHVHRDHVLPRCLGGLDVAENLAWACRRCNLNKGPLLLLDWRPERVIHALRVSSVVHTEYLRQLDEYGFTHGPLWTPAQAMGTTCAWGKAPPLYRAAC